jgi:hypothetical protein
MGKDLWLNATWEIGRERQGLIVPALERGNDQPIKLWKSILSPILLICHIVPQSQRTHNSIPNNRRQ